MGNYYATRLDVKLSRDLPELFVKVLKSQAAKSQMIAIQAW